MKRYITLIIGSFLIGVCCLLLSKALDQQHTSSKQEKLFVYNWGEYIDPDLIKQFEKETGIKVIYETFDSNEAMEAKLRNGGTHYDVVFPSDYTVNKLKKDGLLLPLDHDKLKHLKNIDPNYMNMSFDKGNRYAVPYFFGTVGILYDKDKYSDMTFNSWNDLLKPQLKQDILLVDSAREIVGIALNMNHDSLNTTDPEKLKGAQLKLAKLAPNVKGVVGDELPLMLGQQEAHVAVVWSGVAMPIVTENDTYQYVVPQEGSNLWFDNMVIPKTSQNVDGAHRFIDFLLREDVSAQNTEWVGYATPNREALRHLPQSIRNVKRFYPSKAEQSKLEVYEDLGKYYVNEYNEMFLNFKMSLD
ncbi:ABC transporter substrate-binding protein [Staphylococcus massiliensis]|uniref:ABC transporter substrate-binding protein n=1 Tax=Staphylococcus massiliensis TaxID=555791 RepID=UPI001EE0F2CA|nr:ABC transporter substrate-binding protein [Staphylococcus massiliensis]MCG3413287.1 ABC transporter substrate-binding protein [Staphylococcus massiliensis]